MTDDAVALRRPANQAELDLVAASGWRAWPPRLPDQPFFGHVTRFCVRRAYLDEYEPHEAGGRALTEYWTPAEDLDRFNANLVGPIELVATYRD